jgi:hypothetical protein
MDKIVIRTDGRNEEKQLEGRKIAEGKSAAV